MSIIILNWNGWEDTIECLESLFKISFNNYDVVLIDNASTNNSVEMIKKYCSGNIKVETKLVTYENNNKPIQVFEYDEKQIRNKLNDLNSYNLLKSNNRIILIKTISNYGFSGGCNFGMDFSLKYLDPKYILLLNNDTVVDKDFLRHLTDTIEKKGNVAFVGPKGYYYNEPNKLQFTGGGKINYLKGYSRARANGENDYGQHDKYYELDFINGSCLLCKVEIIKKIGKLDSTYFLIFEETDWCTRAKKIGFKSVYAYKAKIWHKGSASIESKIQTYFGSRNRLYFFKKNSTTKQYMLFLLYIFCYHFWLTTIIYLLHPKEYLKFKYYLKGTIDGVKLITR